MVLPSSQGPRKRGRPPGVPRQDKAAAAAASSRSTARNPSGKGGRSSGQGKATRIGEPSKPSSRSTRTAAPAPASSGASGEPRQKQKPVQTKRKRKASDADLSDREDELASNDYAYMKARTRHIPQEIIKTSWGAPTALVQGRVNEILREAKRAVVAERRDAKRRNEAEVVLGALVKKLEERLPKMPFPPRTTEVLFDLNGLVGRNRGFEMELTPALHSAELLKLEIEKEERALERDRAMLSTLEANAKAEERRQRQHATKAHPLLKGHAVSRQFRDDAQSIGLLPSEEPTDLMDRPDKDLAPLLMQLRNHLDSMQANREQAEGAGDAIDGARAALDEVLYTFAEPQKYRALAGV